MTKYGNPYSEFVHLYPIQSAHTQSSEHTHTHTHTVNTHPEQWAAIYAAAPGEHWGFGRGTSVVVLRVERALYIDSPPTYNFCRPETRTWKPLDYEYDSLTIRPQLTHQVVITVTMLKSSELSWFKWIYKYTHCMYIFKKNMLCLHIKYICI